MDKTPTGPFAEIGRAAASITQKQPSPVQRAPGETTVGRVLASIVLGCITVLIVMLTIKLGLVLFT